MNHKSSSTRFVLRHVGTAGLLLTLSVAGAYAQSAPVNMTVSGSAANSTVILQGSPASEYQLTGNGNLGPVTLRVISGNGTPQASTTCSGPTKLYMAVAGGAAVARFQNGDLLTLQLTDGGDCIDFAVGAAVCTRNFQVIGGNGRFKNAAGGTLTLTMTVTPILAETPTNPVFFAVTGDVSGSVPRSPAGQESPNQ
jgi:hypothetical protein